MADTHLTFLYHAVRRQRYWAMGLSIALGSCLAIIVIAAPGTTLRLSFMWAFIFFMFLLLLNESAIRRLRKSIDRIERIQARTRGVDYD